MKYFLLLVCCCAGLSASAQWYRVDLKLIKHERFPLIEQAANRSAEKVHISALKLNKNFRAIPVHLSPSDFNIEANEAAITRIAEHHMRFREYEEASYSFTELAHLYISQNRFSEAQWFLLQSTIITKQAGNNHHTITNLTDLAVIKANIGQYDLAILDLNEAHDLAASLGLTAELKEIEKKMAYFKANKDIFPKSELRYADAATEKAK